MSDRAHGGDDTLSANVALSDLVFYGDTGGNMSGNARGGEREARSRLQSCRLGAQTGLSFRQAAEFEALRSRGPQVRPFAADPFWIVTAARFVCNIRRSRARIQIPDTRCPCASGKR